MSMDAIPLGGNFGDGLRFLQNAEAITASARAATEWVGSAIRAVREAAEPNPWKTADDETIAGEIVRRIEEQSRTKVGARHAT
jgi:hypothetical protein